MKNPVARLAKIDPRTVWQNEAYDFTPWLAEHLEELGEVLGMDLEVVEREAAVGEFSADIIARDLNQNRVVVIENQLAQTDHSHLGQIITYAAGFDAAVIVWVSREIRDEHRQALDWLNRRSGDDTEFFGVVLELVQIDDSRPAANFRLAAFPNTWSRQTKARVAKAETLTDRRRAYLEFFQALIDELRTKHQFTNARAGQPQNWYTFPTGVSGIGYSASFASGGRLRVELYIDVGDADTNAAILAALEASKAEAEAHFDVPLSWEPLEGRRACRVALYRDNSSITEADQQELLAWTVEMLLRFKSVFGPGLREAVKMAS